MNSTLEKAKALLPNVIKWRRHIHQNAELSFEEHQTQKFIMDILRENGIECRAIAGTGVLAVINGTNPNPLNPMVLRADIDALPITETADIDFACTTGVMHACGHDMHASTLLGALVLLKDETFEGTLWGLFQPGEEVHPGGASIVLRDKAFEGVEPKFFAGLHCSPELETGVIGLCAGQFMASTDELHLKISGRGGHAAMPHLINDTVLASSAVIMSLHQITARRTNAFTPTVISFGRIEAAGATNIIPSEVFIDGTFRTMDETWRAEVKKLIIQIAQDTAKAYGCTAEVEVRDGYPSVMNNDALTAKVERLAIEMFGAERVQQIPRRMTAEDFGFYAARYPAVFFRLGTGGGAPLHNSAFCPNEEALAYGISTMVALVTK